MLVLDLFFIIVAAVLSLVLFCKHWKMCNDVNEIKILLKKTLATSLQSQQEVVKQDNVISHPKQECEMENLAPQQSEQVEDSKEVASPQPKTEESDYSRTIGVLIAAIGILLLFGVILAFINNR